MRASKFGSDLRERFEINFFRQVGHSLLLERGRKREGGREGGRKREGGRGREEEGGGSETLQSHKQCCKPS